MEHRDPSSSESAGSTLPKSPHLHQQPALGYVLIVLGVVAVILGMGEAFMVRLLGEDDAQTYFEKLPAVVQTIVLAIVLEVPEGTPLLVLMLPGLALAVTGFNIAQRGRRHLVATFEVSEPHAFTEPILYLRPFTADVSGVRSPSIFGSMFVHLSKWDLTWARVQWWPGVERYEELLAYAFRRVGTVVTLGDPREPLPLVGATRTYAVTPSAEGEPDDEAWRREVGAQIENARLVLLHIGSSEGLRWEIEQVIARADPGRVVLCVNPPPGKLTPSLYTWRRVQADALKAWTEFREASGAAFPRGLPEAIGDTRFVRFDVDWTARLVERPQRKLFWLLPGGNPDLSRKTVEGALAWLAWMLVPESAGRRFIRRVVSQVLFIAGVMLLWLVLIALQGVFQ